MGAAQDRPDRTDNDLDRAGGPGTGPPIQMALDDYNDHPRRDEILRHLAQEHAAARRPDKPPRGFWPHHDASGVHMAAKSG